MKTVFLIFALGLFVQVSQAKTNFTCNLPIVQQSDIKHVYSLEGEQNPPSISYDFAGPEVQTHYFRLIASGKIVHELEETNDPAQAILKLWFQRVSPPKNDPNLPKGLEDGVRLKMESTYGETYAGLGMRDSYKTYAQSIMLKLGVDRHAVVVLNCYR